ncbi:MAG: hypothetical protein AB7Q17_12710 [Phycisphaerae bacterium]
MRPVRAMWIVAATLCAGVIPAAAQTAFTYQGELSDGGAPANGAYDMGFSLWSAPTGGTQIGTTDGQGVAAIDGLFTAVVNQNDEFGATAFNGAARWLQIAVNGVVLGPRQPLTAAPYAAYAFSGPGGGGGQWAGSGANIYNTNTGNVGIGLTTPIDKLHVYRDGAALRLQDNDDANSYLTLTDVWAGGGHLKKRTASGQSLLDLDASPQDGVSDAWIRFFRDTNTTGAKRVRFHRGNGSTLPSADIGVGGGNSFFQADAGNFGIGTSSPASRFHVQHTGAQRAAWIVSDNTASNLSALRVDTNATNSGVSAVAGVNSGAGSAGYFQISNANNAAPALVATTNGTGPGMRVQVGADSLDVGVNSINTAGDGLFGDPLYLNNNVAQTVLIGMGGGNTGIGGDAAGFPLCKLHVDGGGDANVTSPTAGYFLIGDAFAANIVMDDNEIMARSNGAAATLYLNHDGGDVRIGQNGPGSTVYVNVLAITGADIAEKFPVSDARHDAAPGTVMEIDPQLAGKLRVARGAYNRRVAGVVSGAGDLPVGAVLGNLPGHEDAPPIALSGRVWVRCDAGNAAIAVGDLLTTSDTPGHAMKAADHDRAQGAILGKAMSALAQGDEGLVLVLVSLQ